MKNKKRICYSCGGQIGKQKKYTAKIELHASDEVVLEEEDLKKDIKENISQIYEQVKTSDQRKLEEDVYVSFELTICKTCKDVFVRRIKAKEFI
jgi:hypothetical protein